MKSVLFLICLLTAIQTSYEYKSLSLSISPLDRNVWLVSHTYPWQCNSLVVLMSDKTAVFVDTTCSPAAMDAVIRWTKRELKPTKMIAVNTHFHIDRLGGNAALAKAGIPIYGSETTCDMIDERGKESQQRLASWIEDPKIACYYREFVYVKPDRVFNDGKPFVLKFGFETMRLEYPGVAHSDDNLIVRFPERGILFGGCMIMATDQENARWDDGNGMLWFASLSRIDTNGIRILVPGHGKPGGLELYRHTYDVFSEYSRNER